MSNPYTTKTISDYNTSPPADDATAVASNQLFWSKHKTKLADPIKTLAEAINTELVATFAKLHLNGTRAVTGADTQLAADERKLISVTNTTTYTLLAAATAADGFTVAVLNAGTGIVTIDANGSELIDGALTFILPQQYNLVFLRCDGTGWNVVHTNVSIFLGVEETQSGQTEEDFTGIPAGVKRITIMLDGIDTNGTDDLWVQLGDAGGFEATGYSGGRADSDGTIAANANAFAVANVSISTGIYTGVITLTRMNGSHKWMEHGIVYLDQTTDVLTSSTGRKTLTAELTQVRITTSSGTDVMTAGEINIAYE